MSSVFVAWRMGRLSLGSGVIRRVVGVLRFGPMVLLPEHPRACPTPDTGNGGRGAVPRERLCVLEMVPIAILGIHPAGRRRAGAGRAGQDQCGGPVSRAAGRDRGASEF